MTRDPMAMMVAAMTKEMVKGGWGKGGKCGKGTSKGGGKGFKGDGKGYGMSRSGAMNWRASEMQCHGPCSQRMSDDR